MTITELLEGKMFRQNQSFLARTLGVSRGTVIKYSRDITGAFHFVRITGEEYELFINRSFMQA